MLACIISLNLLAQGADTQVGEKSYLWVENINTNLSSVSFNVFTTGPDEITIKSIKVDNKEIKNNNGYCNVYGLHPSTTYAIEVSYFVDTTEKTLTEYFTTQIPSISIEKTTPYEGKIRFSGFTVSKDDNLTASEYGVYCKETEKYYKATGDVCDATGLLPFHERGTSYTFYPYVIYSGQLYGNNLPDNHGYAESKIIREYTKPAYWDFDSYTTQKTITISNLKYGKDNTLEISEIGFIEEDEHINQNHITVSELYPKCTREFIFYAKIGTAESKYRQTVTTKGFKPSITTKVTPTSVLINTSYQEIDAKVTYSELWINGKVQNKYDGVPITGLKPNTSITIKYVVYPSGESVSKTVKTPELILETLEPKSVNSTTAVVAANTNISDEDLGAGFEWRKVDAPEVVSSRRGNGRIYNGVLEGRIQGLSSDSYYKVRPFYKSDSGDEYFGEWKGFDPSDFSYFEPTVHTYPVTSVSATSASVRAYVMAGTDEIDEQGIEYWPVGSSETQKAKDKANAGNVTTIISTGQVMNVALENLEPSTTYVCRAYVKAGGSTTYGEEQTFTTENASGIIGIETGVNNGVVVTGYYNLQGIRFDEPQQGLNIVKYSDGSVKKIVF